MSRLNFFERMERDIDFSQEYLKIENIVLNEHGRGIPSINDEISKSFRCWKDRRNYTSFQELRQHLGFVYYEDPNKLQAYVPAGKVTGINDFLLYCEMLLNMLINLIGDSQWNQARIQTIVDTMRYDFELINHEIRRLGNNRWIVVQKDAAATAVADMVEANLGDEIIKYNHHLLKGDLESKRIILKKIADALEPERKNLKKVNSVIGTNFFYMVNKMNIRHNNCAPSDAKNYNGNFALLPPSEKEEWYDLIYQEGLMAFLSLEQVNRNSKIAAFKKMCNEEKAVSS